MKKRDYEEIFRNLKKLDEVSYDSNIFVKDFIEDLNQIICESYENESFTENKFKSFLLKNDLVIFCAIIVSIFLFSCLLISTIIFLIVKFLR